MAHKPLLEPNLVNGPMLIEICGQDTKSEMPESAHLYEH